MPSNFWGNETQWAGLNDRQVRINGQGFAARSQVQSFNSDIYHCQQLTRLNQITDQKRVKLANREGVVFH